MPHPVVEPGERPSVVAELHVVPPDGVIALTGEVDLDTIDQLRAALDAVDVVRVRNLVIDLTAVRFASLGALAAIVESANALARRGGQLTVHGAVAIHERVLSLLGAPPGTIPRGLPVA